MYTEKEGDAHTPQRKKPYEAAILELDPTKLPQRISEAQRAILDRAEELLTSGPSEGEQQALNDALRNLRILRTMSEFGAEGQPKMRS